MHTFNIKPDTVSRLVYSLATDPSEAVTDFLDKDQDQKIFDCISMEIEFDLPRFIFEANLSVLIHINDS